MADCDHYEILAAQSELCKAYSDHLTRQIDARREGGAQ